MHLILFIPLGGAFVLLLGGRSFSRGTFLLLCGLMVSAFTLAYGFRGQASGADSAAYAAIYEEGSFYRWEIGYALWLAFLRIFSDSSQIYFALGTFIKLSIIGWASLNLSKRFGYSLAALFLVFFVYSFTTFDLYTNGLRQGLAMTVSVLALSFFLTGRKRVAFFLSASTPLFHASYVVFFLNYLLGVYLSKRDRVVDLGLLLTVSALVACLFVGVSFLSLIEAWLVVPAEFFGVGDKVLYYLGITKGSFSELNFLGKIQVLVTFVLVFVGLWFLRKSVHRVDRALVVMISGLAGSYALLADFPHSYRFLYFVSSLLPFVYVGLLAMVSERFYSKAMWQSAALLFLVLYCFNYTYFVVIRGGLTLFDYPLFNLIN